MCKITTFLFFIFEKLNFIISNFLITCRKMEYYWKDLVNGKIPIYCIVFNCYLHNLNKLPELPEFLIKLNCWSK